MKESPGSPGKCLAMLVRSIKRAAAGNRCSLHAPKNTGLKLNKPVTYWGKLLGTLTGSMSLSQDQLNLGPEGGWVSPG
jgi:hypothetical protein